MLERGSEQTSELVNALCWTGGSEHTGELVNASCWTGGSEHTGELIGTLHMADK